MSNRLLKIVMIAHFFFLYKRYCCYAYRSSVLPFSKVAVGGKNNFLEGVTDRIRVLHNAIACDAARPRTDDVDEHAFDDHPSRLIRRMVLDCPAFAATFWKKALKGKCKLYAEVFRYLKMTHH